MKKHNGIVKPKGRRRKMQKKLYKGLAMFLAAMVVFGALSKVSESVTVPWVEVSGLSSQTLEDSITLEGRIKKSKPDPVFVLAGQKVAAIEVREGQEVRVGMALMSVDIAYLEKQISEKQDEIDKLRISIERAQKEDGDNAGMKELRVRQAREQYQQVVESYSSSLAKAQEEMEQALEAAQSFVASPGDSQNVEGHDLALAYQEKQESYQLLERERNQAVMQAKQAVETAEQEPAPHSDTRSEAIDLKQREEEQERLVQLREQGGKIISGAEGVVTDIQVSVGALTSEEAAFLIEDKESGDIVQVQIEKEDEIYASEGTEILVTGYNEQGETILCEQAAIAGKKQSPENQEKLEVDISLGKGGFLYGSRASVKITRFSEKYEYCVPASAVHESEKGYYVLIVDERQTFTGKEKVAMPVDVEILEMEGGYIAVKQNGLLAGEQIIVNANKALEAGSKVRIKELGLTAED